MRLFIMPAAAATALLIAGCDVSSPEGTSMSIDAGNGVASVNGGTGEVTLDTPLVKGSFKLPKIQFTADNFDINGVHLYPGTKIGAMNVDAGGGEGDGIVRMQFESPAAVATVREWLRREFEKVGTEVEVKGDSLSGNTDNGAFRIDLKPDGERATGTVTIGA